MLRDLRGRTTAYPLPRNSGFAFQVSGCSGSGKSTWLVNILTRRTLTSRGEKTSYRNVFDKIFFVSPSSHTLPDKKPLKHLHHKYTRFGEEVLDEIDDVVSENLDDGREEHYLLVMDGVSNQIRKNKPLETRLVNMLQNRTRQQENDNHRANMVRFEQTFVGACTT